MIRIRLLFGVSVASIFLAIPAVPQRSSAPRTVVVENGSSIQDAIDAVEDAANVDELQRPSRQLPPPTDSDPQLTDLLRQLEQELDEAALHGFKDTKTMERLVGPEFTQRVSDAPERSLPRSLWGQPSGAYKIESIEGRHHSARKLTEDLAVVSRLLIQRATFEGRDRSGDFYVVDIWKKSGIAGR